METENSTKDIEKLNNLLGLIENGENIEQKIKDAKKNIKNFEKEIKKENYLIDKEKESVVKEQMGKSTEREDEKISKLNKRISSEKSRKNMAKKRGQKERIEEKTKSLRMKNRELNRTIRTKLGENDLPTFCNSTWFYVLYCTEGLIEWLIKLTFFAVMFLLIPMLCVCFVD